VWGPGHSNRVPGFWDKEYPGLNQGQAGVRSRHVSGPYRVHFCSPLRQKPDAATWPTARDISQRAEPDVRPLGRAAAAFIADKARRLPIPLAGDVPPQHLMSPVHSVDGRRPGHLVGGVPVHSIGRRHIHTVACAALITTRAYRGSSDDISILYALRALWRSEIAQALQALVTSFHFAPGPTCRGSVSLYVPPLIYKREGTLRYKAGSLRLSDSQVHTSSQAQYNTQWSRVLRSGSLNHSKPLCVLVFFPIPSSRKNA
jgi:hypothetical protein